MESGQPPLDAGNAFGYFTDHGFGFAPPPPHESFDASAALLSKQEISSMDGFFGSFVDPSSYEFTFSVNDVHLPNQFVGLATSLGTNNLNLDDTQPPHFEPYHVPQPNRAPPPPPPHALHYPMAQSFEPHHMSGEILAAAQYLQEGSMVRPPPPQQSANYARFPGTHLRYQPMDDFRQEERRNMRAFDSINHSNTFTDMFFGAPRPQGRSTIPLTLQYGSDSRFVDTQTYHAPERETSEALEREKLRHLQCLDLNQSGMAMGPSSPAIHTNGTMSPGRLKPQPPLPLQHEEDDEDGDGSEVPTPKRRKGKAPAARRSSEEEEEDDDDGSTPPARSGKGKTRKRKPKVGGTAAGTDSPATSDGPSKRRKSNANGAPSKLPRENLTDAQKRENHIKSEQKRRGVIKDGYDGLVEAVPGLRGSGYSKAVILATAGDYLERLLDGNEKLRQHLASLGGEL